MSITIDDILKAASIGEGEDWEFKSAKGGLPGSLWSSYSGMANTEGGTIVLGVSEADSVVRTDGLPLAHAQHLQKDLWDLLHNKNKVSTNLLLPDDIQVVVHGTSAFVVMRVPRATRTQRPIYTGNTPLGNTWRRYHEGDYKCSDAEVRRMLADAEDIRPDQRILQGFTLEDLDTASLDQYRQRFRAARPDHPWLSLPAPEFLEQLGGWRRDRESKQEGITLAGMLMFGKDNAIREPGAAPNYFVDYREKLDPETRWTDRIFPDGNWQANLFQFYHRVWPRLAAGLPTPFKLEGNVRRDETPAHEALREAFVNALIHADYMGEGGVVIERYPDRFEFNNPGILLVSLAQFRKGGVSEGRNKQLQKMFLMLGYGEQAGSGVERIRAGWRDKHWRVPFIGIGTKPDRVILTLPMVSLIPADTLAHLKRSFGRVVDTLKPAELQALATAHLEGGVSNGRLQELVQDHRFDITKSFQHLCEMGLLVSDNKRRWTTYRLPVKGGANMPDREGDYQPTGLPVPLGDRPAAPKGDMPDKRGNMPDKHGQIADKPSRRTRIPPAAIRDRILQLCQDRYLTAKELAQQLGKNDRYLSNSFIYPLVQQGLLRQRYPGSRRKDQAYTAAKTN